MHMYCIRKSFFVKRITRIVLKREFFLAFFKKMYIIGICENTNILKPSVRFVIVIIVLPRIFFWKSKKRTQKLEKPRFIEILKALPKSENCDVYHDWVARRIMSVISHHMHILSMMPVNTVLTFR